MCIRDSGDREVTAHGRTIAPESLRVAIAVLALGATLVLVATLALVHITDESLQRPLFEVISAFGTCGLSPWASPRRAHRPASTS